MFLKSPDNKVEGHKAVDFQLPRYASPAVDIAYYIYTSVKPDIRRTHLEELLEFYLDVLNSTAASLNYPIDMSYEVTH